MKQEIIKWLCEDKGFEAGAKLFQKYGKNMSFKVVLNRQGYSKQTEGVLHEELRKMAELSHPEFDTLLRMRVKKLAPVIAEIIEDLKDAPVEKLIKVVPEAVKKTIRLRDDFPFLKSPDCPNEFKILVADMLTAYDKYRAAHESLFIAENDEKIAELSATVIDNYIENRSIWDELEYFRDNGSILGKHSIFVNKDKFEALKTKTPAELIKRLETLRIGIGKDEKKIAEQPEHKLQQQWKEALESKQAEMVEVKRLLNINE